MNKLLLYLLMFAYSVMIFKPFAPVLADFIAHTFWYSKHMATVHYVNGKYHVHYEFAAAAKRNAHENKSVLKTEESSNFHMIFSDDKIHIIVQPILTNKFHTADSWLHDVCLNSDYPPPKI